MKPKRRKALTLAVILVSALYIISPLDFLPGAEFDDALVSLVATLLELWLVAQV